MHFSSNASINFTKSLFFLNSSNFLIQVKLPTTERNRFMVLVFKLQCHLVFCIFTFFIKGMIQPGCAMNTLFERSMCIQSLNTALLSYTIFHVMSKLVGKVIIGHLCHCIMVIVSFNFQHELVYPFEDVIVVSLLLS